jgi:hypothetical protein
MKRNTVLCIGFICSLWLALPCRADDRATKIDLLPLVSKAKLKAEGLASGKARHATSDVVFPYQPPEEYDLEFTFTRTEVSPPKQNDFIVLLPLAGRSYAYCMRGKKDGTVSLGFFSEKGRDSKLELAELPASKHAGQKYTVLLEVRKDGVKGQLDGKQVFTQEGYGGLTAGESKKVRIITSNNCTALHTMQVREITGKGVVVESPTAK